MCSLEDLQLKMLVSNLHKNTLFNITGVQMKSSSAMTFWGNKICIAKKGWCLLWQMWVVFCECNVYVINSVKNVTS
jgi:hypothetical protein